MHIGGALKDEDISHFNTYGYIVLKQLFSAAELTTIRREFDFMMAEQYGVYDGSRRHWTMMMDEETK